MNQSGHTEQRSKVLPTTICGRCEHEWKTDSGVQVCAKCGNDGEIEGHLVREETVEDKETIEQTATARRRTK